MKNFLVFIVVTGISLNCFGQIDSGRDFAIYPIPKVNSNDWLVLDTAKSKTFSVSVVDGQLKIAEYLRKAVNVFALPKGRILAVDMGEWGGGLYYKPDSGSKQMYYVNGELTKANNQLENAKWLLISDKYTTALIKGNAVLLSPGNIRTVVVSGNEYFFAQGLSHMGNNYGTLSKFTLKEDSFNVSKVCDLKAQPLAMNAFGNWILIATSNSFYIIKQGEKVFELNGLFWEGLNPNSIAVINETSVYVGVHGGYVQINSKNNDMKFYKYIGK